MKRIISLFIICIMFTSLVCSCSLLPENLTFCKVNFYVDGELYDSKNVAIGQTVSEPDIPTKQNYVFTGWVDSTATYKYDFSRKVIDDVDLYAHFTLDAIAFTNMITNQTIKSIVTVVNRSYKGSILAGTAQGSGVVIDVSGGYCYVLTNNHVVENEVPNSKQVLSVEDPWGNVYEATVYKSPSKPDYAKSEAYDLALICFKYSPENENALLEIGLGEDLKVKEYVASLGTPAGLKNAVTYGYIMSYQRINADEESSLNKIEFNIILHNAPIDHGSSGGALVNANGELVGINFAGYREGSYGCAIPISKVKEFLNLYVY